MNISESDLNVPEALFDVRDFLPDGIMLADNGKMPASRLKKIYCGSLYHDAARAWLAMIRAAAKDKVFLNVNSAFQTYRKIDSQVTVFKNRFVPIEDASSCQFVAPPPPRVALSWNFFARPLRTGYLAVIDQGSKIGIRESTAKIICNQMAGFICTDPEPLMKYKRPILVTKDIKSTIQQIFDFLFDLNSRQTFLRKN